MRKHSAARGHADHVFDFITNFSNNPIEPRVYMYALFGGSYLRGGCLTSKLGVPHEESRTGFRVMSLKLFLCAGFGCSASPERSVPLGSGDECVWESRGVVASIARSSQRCAVRILDIIVVGARMEATPAPLSMFVSENSN